MSKQEKKYDSLSTEGKKTTYRQHCVELIFYHRNKKKDLPEDFWKLPKYKALYGRIMKCVGVVIKRGNYSEDAVIAAIKNNSFSFNTFEKEIPLLHYHCKAEQSKIDNQNKYNIDSEKIKEIRNSEDNTQHTEVKVVKSGKSFFELEDDNF